MRSFAAQLLCLMAFMTVLIACTRVRTDVPQSAPPDDEESSESSEPPQSATPVPQGSKDSSGQGRPLLVVIHGCAQNAQAMKDATGFEAEAADRGFSTLYVEQKKGRHPVNCWRWFDARNQGPNQGELGEILEQIKLTIANSKTPKAKSKPAQAIDPAQVFVAGLSSGAATAAALLACHPDVFAGGALLSGPAFGVAQDEETARRVLREGPPASIKLPSGCDPLRFRGRLLVIQGTRDPVVHPRHADRLIAQFTPKDASGDIRGHEVRLQLLAMGKRPSAMICHGTPERICLLKIEGLAHAWAGGPPRLFFDPVSLSATELITRFVVMGERPFAPAANAAL